MADKYVVVDKETGSIQKIFDFYTEALRYVTDVYGPEWASMEIVEVKHKDLWGRRR